MFLVSHVGDINMHWSPTTQCLKTAHVVTSIFSLVVQERQGLDHGSKPKASAPARHLHDLLGVGVVQCMGAISS